MIDKRPAAVVRAAGASDVIQTVRLAAQHGLLLSVRGGGHNIAGSAVCDGGLMLDLSRMRSVRVDPKARTARVEPGAQALRFRQGGSGLRSRDSARDQLDDRRGRTDSRRRFRLAQPEARADGRQPPLRRRRDRSGRARPCERDGAPGSFLGDPRRRRKLRRRDVVRIQAPPGGPAGPRRADRPPVLGREGGAPRVPSPGREGAGRAVLLGRHAQGAASSVPSAGGARHGGARARPVSRRRSRLRRESRCAVPGDRQADRGRRRALPRSRGGRPPSTRCSLPASGTTGSRTISSSWPTA